MTTSASDTDPRGNRRRRHLVRQIMVFLALGLILNIAVALILSMAIDAFAAPSTSLTTSTGVDEKWTVSRYESPGSTAVISEHAAAVSWSYRQACGAPDTPFAGDQVTAWAPSSTDAAIEWLELDFKTAVTPASVKVVETYNPGGLFKVEAYRPDGTSVVAWEGTDPTPPGSGMGTSEVPLKIDFPTRTVRIWIDSPKVAGWNEIDAVGLVDQSGNVQWASAARASSYYGQSGYQSAAIPASGSGSYTTSGPKPADLLPSFGGLDARSTAVSDGSANLERRIVVGYGWPMRSLWMVYPDSAIVPTPTYLNSYSTPTASSVPKRSVLPLLPAWPGFVVNTLLYALILWAFYVIAVRPRRFIVEVGRIRRGACLQCGYNLGYDFVRGCPECGWRRDHRTSGPSHHA
ncbi:hypothetical protein [Humisphaera borealis]|uniref:Pappalysin-1 SD scarf domain-containing protein n=1 Tax=Humisphaera borealis TaxID=2807512 RepID=A0A7M2X310_9BACT|nr:hypothetical protein [Humisphaera borealis]QOV92156.1 hypothetical protein IPV69_12690 [Humisphaera borealis]